MSDEGSSHATRLLLVDDDPRVLASLERTLRREGYEIHTAESPHEALRALAERPFDVILADYKMPGMTGLELLGRAAQRRPETARLLISGWSDQVPRAALQAAGVRALLEKPWDPEELRRVVRENAGA